MRARAFLSPVLTREVVPETGDFTGDTHLDIAVLDDRRLRVDQRRRQV
jgi:hypothetical protein